VLTKGVAVYGRQEFPANGTKERRINMNSRERVITALSRREPDFVPRQVQLTPPVVQTFWEKTGESDYEAYFKNDMRYIEPLPTKVKQDFSRYHDLNEVKDPSCIDEWGIARVPGSLYHFVKIISPLRNAESIEDIEKYPWPDILADYRFEHY